MRSFKEGYYIFNHPTGAYKVELIKVGKLNSSSGYYEYVSLFAVDGNIGWNPNGFHYTSPLANHSRPVEEYFNTDDPKIKPIVEHYFRHYCSDVIYDKLVKGD
jgi:hypothetical protein